LALRPTGLSLLASRRRLAVSPFLQLTVPVRCDPSVPRLSVYTLQPDTRLNRKKLIFTFQILISVVYTWNIFVHTTREKIFEDKKTNFN
jgi:hypothetical protein